MLSIEKFISKKTQTEHGFAMFEVLIGLLIASTFLAASMQIFILAMIFKVEAQEKEIASQLIQQDIEAVKFAADQFQLNLATNLRFNVDSKCLASNYNDGYAKAVFNSLPPIPDNRKLLETQGKEFSLERIEQTTGGNAPYKVLRIKYRVSEWKDGNFVYTTDSEREANAIAKDYIEVIPNAALQCP